MISHSTRSAAKRGIPRPLSLPHLQGLNAPSMVAAEPSQSKSATPVIRWIGPDANHRRRASGSGSNSPSGSAPPSPSLASLNEALNEELPATPPRARLPSSFYASRSLSRPPPFLDNLTRSTLPTSSISPGLPHPYDPNTTQTISLNDEPPLNPVSYSPPGRQSSIDTLRSLRDRGIHTSATLSSPTPSKPNNWWWSQGENKQNVDALLSEEDRASSVGAEQRKHKKKCKQ